MNPQEELILDVLSFVDVVKGKTKFVKMLQLACKLYEKSGRQPPFVFEARDFGGFPTMFEPSLKNLESAGYIEAKKNFLSDRVDIISVKDPDQIFDKDVLEMRSKIKPLIQTLNHRSAEEVIAICYHYIPESTENSKIKPKINKKFTELFSTLSKEYDGDVESEVQLPSSEKYMNIQTNDLDVRKHMMESLGITDLPPIIPSKIDESTGLLAKNHPFFDKYDLEEMLKNARRG